MLFRSPSLRPTGFSDAPVAAVVAAINTASVLNEIRRHGVVSRVELADNLGLGRSTITDITQRLLASGHILEGRFDADPAEGNRGRPRIGLRLNPNAGHVAGIKISMHQIAISIADFACNLIGSTVVPVRSSKQAPEVVADLIDEALRQATADAGLSIGQLDGVGVGVPGFIDGARGTCHWSPVFRDADVPFAGMLADRLHLPVFVENDANLVALAEHWFGEGTGADELVVVTIEHGVGMGLVLDGRIFRGRHGFASEFGHMQVVPGGAPCRCGQVGCIEAYVSDYALVRAAEPGNANLDDPFELECAVVALTAKARAGDPVARQVFAEAGTILGRGIANLVKVIDPERIIFCGNGLRAVDLWFEDMRNTVAAMLRHPAGRNTEYRIHRWGDDVWARGAAAFVLQALYQSHKAFLHPVPAAAPQRAAAHAIAT